MFSKSLLHIFFWKKHKRLGLLQKWSHQTFHDGKRHLKKVFFLNSTAQLLWCNTVFQSNRLKASRHSISEHIKFSILGLICIWIESIGFHCTQKGHLPTFSGWTLIFYVNSKSNTTKTYIIGKRVCCNFLSPILGLSIYKKVVKYFCQRSGSQM